MKIKLCSRCSGNGIVYDYSKQTRRDEYEEMICPRCNGTGRIYSTSVSFSLNCPYGQSDKILYDFDSEMYEVYRKYKSLTLKLNS